MASLVLNGNTSGTVTLSAPAVSGTLDSSLGLSVATWTTDTRRQAL